ncbi:MAG: hypothetical protein QNJ53_04360 [Pleurocapsa sp. MO_192.B19]|nr:hypothetical protein [Pleurocapsa sp. MO_192.B19]
MDGIAAIRKRPGMFIVSTGSRGLHQLLKELISFSLANNSKNIEIVLEDNNTISFRDRDYSRPLNIDEETDKSWLETVLTTTK